jgi:hypothetical protein
MAKPLPKNIQDKFDKLHFKHGDAVFFSWLGQKKYGYVIKTKTCSWGIQYTVETNEGRRYPCGIQIAGNKTQYSTGCIFFEETRTLGADTIREQINSARPTPTVLINTRRPTSKSTDDDKRNTGDAGNDKRKNSKAKRSGSSTKNDPKSSSNGVSKNTRSKRKNSDNELNQAIEKQRNFLNGFVKKD